MTRLQAKLDAFDTHAPAAFDELLKWLQRDREALIAAAKGRLVEGHYRYGDRLMYEYGQKELLAEASQEIADAINYLHLRVQRAGSGSAATKPLPASPLAGARRSPSAPSDGT